MSEWDVYEPETLSGSIRMWAEFHIKETKNSCVLKMSSSDKNYLTWNKYNIYSNKT